MELWIRSQSKMKFRRVIDLGIFEEQEGYTIYCDDSIDNILGTYKNKKRALKLLDEIQDLMRSLSDSDLKIIQYEMPKE